MTVTQPPSLPARPPRTRASGHRRADTDLLRRASSTLRTHQSA